MTVNGYLDRLLRRRQSRLLRETVIFGLVIGWLFVAVGSLNYFLVVGANDRVWLIAIYCGLFVLLVTTAMPHLVHILYKSVHVIGEAITTLVFRTILLVVYVLMILPVGLWLRWRYGTHPFYEWTAAPPPVTEGWVIKKMPVGRITTTKQPSRLHDATAAIGHFISIRSYVYLPVLIALLALGIVLFMVQSSTLAPFIYTLF